MKKFSMRNRKLTDVWLYPLFILALVLRLLLSFLELSDLPGESSGSFINNDSFSYSKAAISILETGEFRFDPTHPESKYGRLPGYPLFWGLHYIVVGKENVYQAVAISQSLLDALLVILFFRIAMFLSRNKVAAYATSALYALNPIAIYWAPITGTETLGVFLSVLFFYVLFTKKDSKWYFVMVGLIGVSAFYVRPYLAVLMVSAIIYFLVERVHLKNIAVSAGIFWLIFLIWPIRNYLESGELILVKTSSSGYHRYGSDVSSARQYIFTWSTEFDYYMDKFLESGELNLPPEAIPDGYEASDILSTFNKAAQCGSGFNFWKDGTVILNSNCNDEIKAEFDQYRAALYKSSPIYSMTFVPIQNWKKALFKSQTVAGNRPTIERFIFFFRSVILVLSILGLLLFRGRWKERLALGIFALLIYVLITTILRQVEMRYLLQADAILIISFSMLLAQVQQLSKRRKGEINI